MAASKPSALDLCASFSLGCGRSGVNCSHIVFKNGLSAHLVFSQGKAGAWEGMKCHKLGNS